MKEDLKLRLNVQGELDYEPSVDSSHLTVTTHSGLVLLSGTVRSFAEKLAAVRAAERVSGVREVSDLIRVTLSADHQRTDTEIVHDAQEALRLFPHGGVMVQVEDGWATLEGKVNWQFERRSAYDAVAALVGVKGVENLITLKPQASPHLDSGEIEASIRRAFVRRSNLHAEQVRVEVVSGHVSLSGHLTSWTERKEAARAAWNVAGVTSVENHIGFGIRSWSDS